MTGEVDLPQAALLEASFDLVRIHGGDVALSCEHRNYEDRKFLLANEFRLSHISAMWTDSPPRSSLPKELYADADVIEKARAMLRAGGSGAFVSDYLGMKPAQVAEIRRDLCAAVRGRPPAPIADDAGAEDRKAAEARRLDAECGSAALLAAIRRYLARHHPNDECRGARLMAKRRSKGGRPRKSGARHPCGKLRTVRDEGSERTVALRLRFRPFQGGKGDQYAGTPIGRAWLVGLLDGHDVDPAAIRDAGLSYGERYWGYWPAPGGVSNYEGEDRRAAPFAGGLDIAGDRFQALDAAVKSAGRASYDAVQSLVVDPHWFPEENPPGWTA